MKAARYYGPGDIRVEQVAEPTPKNGQVKIKVRRFEDTPEAYIIDANHCIQVAW